MKLTHPLTAAILVIAAAAGLSVAAGVDGRMPQDPSSTPRNPQSPNELPVAVVRVGDEAPDFAFEGEGDQWLRLQDVRAQGHVLLVFAPTESQMKALERETGALRQLGIVSAVVLDRRSGPARRTARRLGITSLVIPDPHRAIATQFNNLRKSNLSAAPGWFVIDRDGNVRGMERGRVAVVSWAATCTTALALPTLEMPLPATTR